MGMEADGQMYPPLVAYGAGSHVHYYMRPLRMFLRMERWLTVAGHLENSSLSWLSSCFVSRPPACQTVCQALLSGHQAARAGSRILEWDHWSEVIRTLLLVVGGVVMPGQQHLSYFYLWWVGIRYRQKAKYWVALVLEQHGHYGHFKD